MLYTVETQTRAPDAWLEVGRAPVTLETVSHALYGLVIDRGGDSAGVFLSNQAFPTASRALCELHLPAWNRKIRYHRNIPPPWTPCGFRMPPCHTVHGAVSGVWWPYARWFEAGVAPRLYVGLELRDGLPCKRRSPKHCWSCAPEHFWSCAGVRRCSSNT